ncbi:3-beta hydroxysteroid dehydrogenase/isomerase family-domain-containing protein [Cadophora sp. MPI-SDFR-AT-0126]|nr:3-beta hydroxysteroid dehydrogenase/isomerase family-domain-containing protein [Leotiomycetes sp. MPI-SDFR-AT-0126]
MAQLSTPLSPKSILAVGGCGFLGHHIVKSLLKEDEKTSSHPEISVVDLNTSRNRYEGVTYHTCDITSLSQVRDAISTIKPQVIIHTASALPNVLPTHGPDDVELFQKVNVDGTANLLECAKDEGAVEVFVYTSSATILQQKESYMATEDAVSSEVQMSISRFDPYSGTKGIADTMVLLANSRKPSNEGGLRTCCLRIGGMYGVGDMTLIWSLFETLRLGQHRHQMGDGSKLSDFLAVENAAHAHILAMNALLAGTANLDAPKVDGEGFFITDGNPMSYWAFRLKLWAYAGHKHKAEDVKIVSASFVMAVVFILEWIYFIFSLGYKQPKVLRRRKLEWVCLNRTFDLTKAKERLGYVPKVSTDDALKAAAEWALGYQTELGLLNEKKSL